MTEQILISAVLVIGLGIAAQWTAWRLGLPSILLLLSTGIIAGPLLGRLDPDALLGDLLPPLISLSVAVILFEGGLSLTFSGITGTQKVVRNLVSLGTLVTWMVIAAAARLVLGLDISLSVLLGAILVVTGPTVIGPMMRQIRPGGRTGPILMWEGILIDPIGAVLSLLVFEVIISGGLLQATGEGIILVLKVAVIGCVMGFAGAAFLAAVIGKFLIPDHLENPTALAVVALVFAVSDLLQSESGLLSVTLMGIILANQGFASVRKITDFKEDLSVILISILFIILSARLDVESLDSLGIGTIVFIFIVIFVARPAAVLVSTMGSNLGMRERFFLSFMAPRGIVAAAVGSIFTIHLVETGYAGASTVESHVFAVIIATVLFYGLLGRPLAVALGISEKNLRGILLLGGSFWASSLAEALNGEVGRVVLVDSNPSNIRKARRMGIEAIEANILSEEEMGKIDLSGIGKFLALTTNDEVNSLAAMRFSEILGKANVYQLPWDREDATLPVGGRIAFGAEWTARRLSGQFIMGASPRRFELRSEEDMEGLKRRFGDSFIPLFQIDAEGNLEIHAEGSEPRPEEGKVLLALARDPESSGAGAPPI